MAKLKVGDVVEVAHYEERDDATVHHLLIVASLDGGCVSGRTHWGDDKTFPLRSCHPRRNLLPYGKLDAKWWKAIVWCRPDGWSFTLHSKQHGYLEGHGYKTRAAAIRALRNLAIEYGMNIKIMEDEG